MMKSLLFLALVVLLGCGATEACAQDGAPPTPAQPGAPALTAAQAQQALDALQDPEKRAQLIGTLRAIVAATPDAAPAATPDAPVAPAHGVPPTAGGAAKPAQNMTLKPNSLGAQLFVALSHWSKRLGREAAATLQTMNNSPALARWIVDLKSDPQSSMALAIAAGWLALVFGCALLLELFVAFALRRPRDALLRHLPQGNGERTRLLRLLPYALVRLALELVPVGVFAAIGNVLVGALPGIDERTRLVVIAIVNAYAVTRAVMCVARLLLSPDDVRLRLWRLDDSGARFVLVWVRRMVIIAVFGDAIVEVALLLGLDQSAHDGFERLISLVLTIMAIFVVIRSRRSAGAYIRGAADSATRWRGWLAEAWPYLAVIAIVSFWIGSATGSGGGLSGLYFPGVTLAAIIAARLLTIVVLGLIERLLRLDPDTRDKLPGLSQRIAAYRRPLDALAVTVITLLCIVIVLQLWGAPAFAWLTASRIGPHLLSALATVTVAVILAVGIWEVCQAVLERQLARTGVGGRARSARLLTLMPLLRTALLATIVAVVGLTALSEIGINIAPLLAGAGIVGIAVGFGSQHLVQDVITGMFVLFENAIQVGDNVTAAGLSGSVEQLSVRTLRLRAGDGSVHIIPFSSVTTISNTNRGIGNAPVAVTVAFHEDTDRVAQVLRDIVAEMREEEQFGRGMLSDLQLWGVDAVRPWGVTISGQIVCTDTSRWPVQREFNRRLKKRFEAEGIEFGGSPQAVART